MSLTPEQIEERRLGIGGSDAAIILGLNDWATPVELYLNKIGLHEFVFPESILEKIYWGNVLEPVIFSEYQKKLGNDKIIAKPEGSIVHKDYPWMRANLDFICLEHGFIGEIKTACMNTGWYEHSIPNKYLVQVAHNRIVAESHYGVEVHEVHVPVLLTNSMKVYTYFKNEAFEESIIKLEEKFWNNHVVPRIAPDSTCLDDARLLFPKSSPNSVTASEGILECVDHLNLVKKNIKNYTLRKENIEGEIADFMGENEILLHKNGNVLATHKKNKNGSKVFRLKGE